MCDFYRQTPVHCGLTKKERDEIMKTANKLLFDDLDNTHYKNAPDASKDYFVFKKYFKESLGYDNQSGGYLALQKGHQPKALLDELPTALLLKKEGFAVVLLNETGEGKKVDALIDGVASEIKDVKTLTYRSLKDDFKESLKKGAKRVVLVVNKVDREVLKEILKRIAHNPFTNQIDDLFLIVDGKLEKCQLSHFK